MTGPVAGNHVGAKQNEIRKEAPFTYVLPRSPSPVTARREGKDTAKVGDSTVLAATD